ncbi:MAG: hypothetical protein ABIZ49_07140, partial [Opitutaceae bacterium]
TTPSLPTTPPPTAVAHLTATELSPFVVSGTTDASWIATETLAGTRLRTNFKDLANQIETLTKGFMDDLGLTNAEQSLMYTANVENGSDYVQNTSGNAIVRPSSGGRIRGLGAGTLSRNFFPTSHPTDNFNLERVTLASGPNAILFGLGSPAGILDATPARAALQPRYGFTLLYDSEDSRRATFDANAVIVPRKLAVRLMGLAKREFTEKRPNFERDERLYATLTFTPFESTTVVVQAERAKRASNRAHRIAPGDFTSLWYRAHEIPGSGYSRPRPAFDNANLAGFTSDPIFVQAADAPVLIGGASTAPMNWRNSVTVKNPSSLSDAHPTFDAAIEHTILDPRIFPFDVNVLGTSGTTLTAATTRTVFLEQKLARALFLELAYNGEDADERRAAAGADLNFNLHVDANAFLPGTRTPNPHFGKLFYQGPAYVEPRFDRREDWRAALSYELAGARASGARGPWARWLGRHRFSALYSSSRAETKNQIGILGRILDEPAIAGLTLAPKSQRNWATHTTRVPLFRHYFATPHDPTPAAGPLAGDWSLTDANGKPFALYRVDTPLRSPDGKRLASNQAAGGNRTQASAQVLAWQGFFLPDPAKHDRLVLTLGYRQDAARSATLDVASTTQDFSGLFPVLWDTHFAAYGPVQRGINRNLGIVARPWRSMSVFYNRSTTFDLSLGRFDPFGMEIPGAGGKGRDFGVRLDLGADTLSLRLNRYDNTLGPQRASNQINLFRDFFFNVEDRVRTLDPEAPTLNVVEGNRRGFRAAGRTNYFITSEFEASGYELELNATPSPNWNVRVNGARSKATESNIGRPWFAWAAQRLPVWRAVVARNGEVDATGQPVTWRTAPASATSPTGQTLEHYYNAALVGQAFAFMQAADGRATDSARETRANAIANYRFTEGRLNGILLGGALRWRAPPTIGYGLAADSAGAQVLDLGQPLKGRAEIYFDATLGYRGRVKALGGVGYRLQLNLRNVLDEHDPVPTARLTTGAIAKLATVEPRVIVASFTMDF